MKDKMHYWETNLLPLHIEAYQIWSIFIGTITAFVWEVQSFIILLFGLIVADLVTGMISAKHRKEKISSRGIFRTVEKILVETIAILACEGIRIVLIPWADITYVAVFVIAASELKSIIENVEYILGVEIWKTIKEKIGIK